jgi:hypothetical protein
MSEGKSPTTPKASTSQLPATPPNEDLAMGEEMSSLVQSNASSKDASTQKVLSGPYVPFMIMPDIKGNRISEEEDASDEEEDSFRSMMNKLRSIKRPPSYTFTPRFFGKSSNLRLIRSALESKDHAMGPGNDGQSVNHLFSNLRSEYWKPYPVSACNL